MISVNDVHDERHLRLYYLHLHGKLHRQSCRHCSLNCCRKSQNCGCLGKN